MDHDAQIRELNDLYQLMADGRKGYSEAAERVKDERLAGLLADLGQQRERMENDLAGEIRRFKRDDHTQEGTMKGVLHRAWMDIRTALGKADNTTVLDECERGERYLLDRLTTVIGLEDIAPTSHALLLAQRGTVEQSLAQVEQVRNDYAAVGK